MPSVGRREFLSSPWEGIISDAVLLEPPGRDVALLYPYSRMHVRIVRVMVFLLSEMMASASLGVDEGSCFPSKDSNAGEACLLSFAMESTNGFGVFLRETNSRAWLRLLLGRGCSARDSKGLPASKFAPTEKDRDRCDAMRFSVNSLCSSGSSLTRRVCGCWED